jgi:hypothetical protein
MSQKDIEARLDRSLANQIDVPRLDRRFDAAVWARIAAAEESAKATIPIAATASSAAIRASRWLAVSNTIGVAVTLGVALYFVLRTVGGIELPATGFDMSTPVIAEDVVARVVGVLGQVLGLVALVFGLSFTSLGRRVRASFS